MERFEDIPVKEAKENTPSFHTPYYEVTLKEFGEAVPEKKEALKTVLDELDKQGIENFATFKSETMLGVSFSFTKLTVTPELIHRLSKIEQTQDKLGESAGEPAEKEEMVGSEEGLKSKKHDYFLFTAFAPPPDGHAFTVEDVAIDRYIRLLPRVARPLKAGEEPPEVNVYLLGSATGFGGSVTPEWINGIKKNGVEEEAKLYSEFIKQKELQENNDVHIVLQGVSKGAVIAEKTSKYLPEKLQKNTQRLLDNPSGEHDPKKISRWLKGAKIVAGLGGETVARILFDDTMKSLMKKGGAFIDNLSKEKGIPKDGETQKKLKLEAALAEGTALLKGSNSDKERESTRSFIRRAIYDPQTFSLTKLAKIWKKQHMEDVKIPFFQKGKSLEVPFKGNHFFFYNRYKRWAKILDFSETVNKEN